MGRKGNECFRPLLLAAVVVAANRLIRPDISIHRLALLDEAAHVATALLARDALASGRSKRFQRAALVGSVVVDIDHAPEILLGWRGLTTGTPRPYPHALPTFGVLVGLARVAPSEQQLFGCRLRPEHAPATRPHRR
jgi:hypothetical protein